MKPVALARPTIDARTVEDAHALVKILRRFVQRSFALMDATQPYAARELNAMVAAGSVRILVEHDLTYPGKITLLAANANGVRGALTCMTLDRADPNFLRVIVPTDDASATDNVVLN